MWDLRASSTPTCVTTLVTARAITCTAACQKPGCRLVGFGSTDAVFRTWDPREKGSNEKNAQREFLAHKEWLSTLSWCPQSEHVVASGSYDGAIKVWDIRT